MFLPTFVGLLAFAIGCFSNLFLIGAGLWILRRVKLPCLPWVIACWGLSSPLLIQLNSWCLDRLTVALSLSGGVSLSGLGLFTKRDAMRQFMGWDSLISSVGGFAIALLVVADAVFLVSQLKPGNNDRVPRILGLVRTFSPVFGFSALVFAVTNHFLALFITHIEP